MTLPILCYPHPALTAPADAATADDETRALAAQMRETMLKAGGIGLAAPQVGRGVRLLVADVSDARDEPITLLNPVITHSEGAYEGEEGCLSLPGVRAKVRRAARVLVRGEDENGGAKEIDAEGILAVCLQHEIDHLNGVLFFHHLSRYKRDRLLAKYKKLRETENGGN